MGDVTHILTAIERGDPDTGRLWPFVYGELQVLVAAQVARERPGQTFDATALVHDVYLRLAVGEDHRFANRRHFFAAAVAMRRILVEAARARGRDNRGGRRREYPDLAIPATAADGDLVALHEAPER